MVVQFRIEIKREGGMFQAGDCKDKSTGAKYKRADLQPQAEEKARHIKKLAL